MKKLILFLITLISVPSLYAQQRYLEEITDSVQLETFTYIQKDGQNLDVYTPFNDNETARPVYLY